MDIVFDKDEDCSSCNNVNEVVYESYREGIVEDCCNYILIVYEGCVGRFGKVEKILGLNIVLNYVY